MTLHPPCARTPRRSGAMKLTGECGSRRGPSGSGPSSAAGPSWTPSTRGWCGRCPTTPPTTCPEPTSGAAGAVRCAPSTRPAAGTPTYYDVRVVGRVVPDGGVGLPGLAHGGAARPRALPVGRDGRVAGGGRAGLRPPAQPVRAGRHPGQLPAGAGPARRRRAGRLLPPAHPVRDRAAAALLPAAVRPPHRAAGAVRAPSHCPYKGTASYWSRGRRATAATRTSSGSTAARSPRAPRSRGWPASTTSGST